MTRKHYPEEWEVFLKNARRFDDNPPEKRYGIVNPSVDHPKSEDDMLWSHCPRELHNLHYDNYPPIAIYNFINKVEVMEGKKPRE